MMYSPTGPSTDPVKEPNHTLLVTDCFYRPVSMFMYNSILNYEYMNLVLTYDLINHLNFIMDVPFSLYYKSLFYKYNNIYPYLILPWTFNQIVELYNTYIKVINKTNGTSMVKGEDNEEPVLEEKKLVDTGELKHSLEVDIPENSSKSFFYDLKKKFTIIDNKLQMKHINIKIVQYKKLSNNFDNFIDNIKNYKMSNLEKDEKIIFDIIKKQSNESKETYGTN